MKGCIIKPEEVLKYDYPYADGYKGFWENPIALQHPLAVSEIVVWDKGERVYVKGSN